MSPVKDSNYNFETNGWTSAGTEIDSHRWKNISSPYNEGKRYYPILNDRLLWRMWRPADSSERYLWSYGPHHNEVPYDYEKFYLQTYSSTDLIKSDCDENELFTSKIKCLKGINYTVSQQLCLNQNIEFQFRLFYLQE